MSNFIVRTTAYHGNPLKVGKVYVRAGVSIDTPVAGAINRFDRVTVIDVLNNSSIVEYDIDALLADFQGEYRCKVNYDDDASSNGDIDVFSFDVFEPSWDDQTTAENVVKELNRRIADWAQGYPSGR